MMKRKKIQGQELVLVEHLNRLERNGFRDFDKPSKRAYHKGKIESNEQSKEGGQPDQLVEKGGVPDRVKSFQEINSGEDHTRPQLGFAKPILSRPRKEQNLT